MTSNTASPLLIACIVLCVPTFAYAQEDFRIRAKFRAPDNGLPGADASVGNAEFRVVSRFGKVYYGGVIRSDEFKFKVQFDFSQFTDEGGDTSLFEVDYDVYINEGFVGRVDMAPGGGTLMGELEYDSRNPTSPALPLPIDFPQPVNVGDVAAVFTAALELPVIGNSLPPGGIALFEAAFEDRFLRGDFDSDGRIDENDIDTLVVAALTTSGELAVASLLDVSPDGFLNVSDVDVLIRRLIGTAYGDADLDGNVSRGDMRILAEQWQSSVDSWSDADFDGSGLVDINDAVVLRDNWGFGDTSAESFEAVLADEFDRQELVAPALPAPPMLGDATGDGRVDRADSAVLIRHLGMTSGALFADGDFDGDRAVTLRDLATLQTQLSVAPSSANVAVPEPSTLLLAIVALGLTCVVRTFTNPRRGTRPSAS